MPKHLGIDEEQKANELGVVIDTPRQIPGNIFIRK